MHAELLRGGDPAPNAELLVKVLDPVIADDDPDARAVAAIRDAVTVNAAVSPSTLGASPVKLSVMAPAVAVRLTVPPLVPPARMRLTATLPAAEL